MNHHATDAHTLAAAYALGALDDTERKEFDAHLRTCEACRQEVAEFQATTARLAAAVSQAPPAAAKAEVMAAIDGVRQLPPRIPAPSAVPALGGFLRRRAVPWALAASVAAAVLGGVAVWQTRSGQDLEQQARQAQQQLDAVSAVLAAPDARTAHGKAANGALTTVVSSDQQNQAVFTAANLPAPGVGKTYQLWLDHEGTMRPAGLIEHDGTVILAGNPADAGAVGLTLEPAGGSPEPTTAPLLLMAMPA
ncbi:anti-sigma factor [Streptomyces venezuelae]|uniref:anti-sigma factor n=1 Tax=Streptomyces venezuelae TaxID=54571 RepID=UPI001238659B|nr:anti-sigma factor [Streptomyces venezuelae]QES04471.1 anti-sigma factor [Streptomyces venezuelae]